VAGGCSGSGGRVGDAATLGDSTGVTGGGTVVEVGDGLEPGSDVPSVHETNAVSIRTAARNLRTCIGRVTGRPQDIVRGAP